MLRLQCSGFGCSGSVWSCLSYITGPDHYGIIREIKENIFHLKCYVQNNLNHNYSKPWKERKVLDPTEQKWLALCSSDSTWTFARCLVFVPLLVKGRFLTGWSWTLPQGTRPRKAPGSLHGNYCVFIRLTAYLFSNIFIKTQTLKLNIKSKPK